MNELTKFLVDGILGESKQPILIDMAKVKFFLGKGYVSSVRDNLDNESSIGEEEDENLIALLDAMAMGNLDHKAFLDQYTRFDKYFGEIGDDREGGKPRLFKLLKHELELDDETVNTIMADYNYKDKDMEDEEYYEKYDDMAPDEEWEGPAGATKGIKFDDSEDDYDTVEDYITANSEWIQNKKLNESVEQITALFGGGFKPPTKGHLDVVLNGLKQNPEINNLKIIVGGGVRDGITQDQSARIWELYRDIGFIPVETEIIKASPFNYYKEYLRSNPDSKTYVFIGSREGNEGDQFDFKQRSEFVKKYNDNVIPVEISTTGGISGTEARKLFKTDLESFKDMLPEKLTVGGVKRIVDILNGKSKDSTNNPSFDRTEPLTPLNEGRYDTISNKISSDIFRYWKDNLTDRAITFTNTYQHEGENIDVEATLKQTPEIEYLNVDGGADDETDYIVVSFEVNPYELPQALMDISFNLKDVIRHEIEHLTHGEGFMSKSGKYMENDEMIRKMIDMEFLPKSSYFTLEKEVDANLQGMYFRAKKEKRPFRDVINVYLDAQKITPEEKEKIINLWSKRTRALGLPSIDNKENINESTSNLRLVQGGAMVPPPPVLYHGTGYKIDLSSLNFSRTGELKVAGNFGSKDERCVGLYSYTKMYDFNPIKGEGVMIVQQYPNSSARSYAMGSYIKSKTEKAYVYKIELDNNIMILDKQAPGCFDKKNLEEYVPNTKIKYKEFDGIGTKTGEIILWDNQHIKSIKPIIVGVPNPLLKSGRYAVAWKGLRKELNTKIQNPQLLWFSSEEKANNFISNKDKWIQYILDKYAPMGSPKITQNPLTEELLNEVDLKKYVNKAKSGFKKFIGALKQESKETKEAFKLLAQSVKGEKQLSKEEKKEIGNQLKDVFKTIGYIGLFALPGGSIFTILFNLLKLNKYVLPSSFQTGNITEASGDKILYAFDLDDTLITSNSSVIITNPEQGTFKLTPAEYALYEPGPDDELDFSEFAHLKDPKVIKDNFNLFSQILNKSSKLAGAKTIILTARQPEVSTDVEAFLEQNNLPQITLHAVGSSDPNEKLKVIEDYIDQGFNKIRFYDDSPKNVKSIKSISRPGVDVVSKLVKHGPLSERFLNEAIVGDKIECDKCDWSWNIKDGGDDLYVCHKCGYDNEPLNESKDPFGLIRFVNEIAEESEFDYTKHIDSLNDYMVKNKMNVSPLPKVTFIDDDEENANDVMGKTAYYDPNKREIVLYTLLRHPKDILRSYAHEMIHHIQNLEDRLGNITTTNTTEDDHLTAIEKEAYTDGNLTFRKWTETINEITDQEMKYWAFHSDIFSELRKFGVEKYEELKKIAKGERLQAVEHFWDLLKQGKLTEYLAPQEEVRIFNENCGCNEA